jgi:hypothetical protein
MKNDAFLTKNDIYPPLAGKFRRVGWVADRAGEGLASPENLKRSGPVSVSKFRSGLVRNRDHEQFCFELNVTFVPQTDILTKINYSIP